MKRLSILAVAAITSVALLAPIPSGALAAHGKGKAASSVKKAGKSQRIAGTIANSTSNSLTIKLKNGSSVTVQLGAKTHYVVNGKRAASKPTFSNGVAVQVIAQKQSDGSLLAREVVIGKSPKTGAGKKGRGLSGTIVGSSANSVTIKLKNGTSVTVTFNSKTRFVVNGNLSSTPPPFNNGDKVHVVAIKQADGSLLARLVVIGKAPAKRGERIVGTIAGFSGNSLTITEKNGTPVTVQLGPKTRYLVNRKLVANQPSFIIGEVVRVNAVKQADGTLLAKVVSVTTA